MTAGEMRRAFGIGGAYDAWPFGSGPDGMAAAGRRFTEDMPMVCNEFAAVYPRGQGRHYNDENE